ncbi:Hypothetical predicted protein, partial [Pelobates cultripes]
IIGISWEAPVVCIMREACGVWHPANIQDVEALEKGGIVPGSLLRTDKRWVVRCHTQRATWILEQDPTASFLPPPKPIPPSL